MVMMKEKAKKEGLADRVHIVSINTLAVSALYVLF